MTRRWFWWVLSLATALGVTLAPATAQAPLPPAEPAVQLPASQPEPPAAAPSAPTVPGPASANAQALRDRLTALAPAASDSDEDRNEYAAVLAFYEARAFEPAWIGADGLSVKAQAAIDEIARADDWGLSKRDFPMPAVAAARGSNPGAAESARAEAEFVFAALKYARFARGGRIINPAEQLSSYLDRRPQLLKPAAVLETLTAADDIAAALRGLHPQHPQFEKLRQAYLASHNRRPGADNLEARKILANMEQWRWMPADLGAVYIWNNLPEFLQRVVVDGEIVRTERIVAGETGKQTPVFSRPLRRLVFKPTWIVPDSIKVREIWPSLLRGGGLMREWALEVTTKDGKPLDWRRMDWAHTDIREVEVIQPNGPKSVMGKFKFSFPNQHTVFMHDTLPRDRYMFNVAQRTYSHGCIRVNNPMQLAEIILRADKGWEPEHTRQMFASTPNNHTIDMEKRVMVHLTYFTARVNEAGKLETFRDVYGHERRILQALDGRWREINKGRDHLAPVELNLSAAERIRGDEAPPSKKGEDSSFFTSLFGNF